MDGDIFVNNNHNNFIENGDSNFFLESTDMNLSSQESVRRLNDYDYNILQEEAYKDITDELFKLEYKIFHIEKEIQTIDSQIQSARAISDYDNIEYLSARKKQLNEDLDTITSIYNEKSLASKISGGIFKNFKKQFEIFGKVVDLLKNMIISKLPQRVSSVLNIKQSISKLESINKSVDELMTMQTPYGESWDKYNQLSKYISKANSIQSKISKIIK